jgi:hypothetical protein
MTYQIQSDIPAPAPRNAGRPAAVKYPFAQMAVGQSFFAQVAVDPGKSLADAQSTLIDRLRSAANRWRKTSGNTGFQFRVDVYTDAGGNNFVGCWRVA